LTKCGFTGVREQDIKVNYDLTLRFKLLLITIAPTVSSSTSFACPIKSGDLAGLTGGSGGLGDIISSLGGGGTLRKRDATGPDL
jgi:hypothetical protein